jgi:hypothetical protein
MHLIYESQSGTVLTSQICTTHVEMSQWKLCAAAPHLRICEYVRDVTVYTLVGRALNDVHRKPCP